MVCLSSPFPPPALLMFYFTTKIRTVRPWSYPDVVATRAQKERAINNISSGNLFIFAEVVVMKTFRFPSVCQSLLLYSALGAARMTLAISVFSSFASSPQEASERGFDISISNCLLKFFFTSTQLFPEPAS